jgi:hypothetical protein
MKYFWYRITDEEISALIGEVEVVSPEFIELKSTLVGERVYYKIKDGKITEAIGEGLSEESAKRRVQEFISALNVNVF